MICRIGFALALSTACGSPAAPRAEHAEPVASPPAVVAVEPWSEEAASALTDGCPDLALAAFSVAPYTGIETAASSREARLANEEIVATNFSQDPRAFLVTQDCADPETNDCMTAWGVASTRDTGTVVAGQLVQEFMPVGPELGFHWESLRILADEPLTVELSGLNSGVETDEEGLRGSSPWEPVTFHVVFGEHLAIAWSGATPVEVETAHGSLTIRACGNERTVRDAAVTSSSPLSP